MAEEKLNLEVVTPEQAVLSEEIDEVVLPGEEGQFGVLPGHLPLLSSLTIGELVVIDEGDEENYFVDGGLVEVLEDRVSVLTKTCAGVEDIDIEHAREELQVAEEEIQRIEELAEPEEEEEVLLGKYRESMERARQRLMVADKASDQDVSAD